MSIDYPLIPPQPTCPECLLRWPHKSKCKPCLQKEERQRSDRHIMRCECGWVGPETEVNKNSVGSGHHYCPNCDGGNFETIASEFLDGKDGWK
jgi:hypothetical protein